MVKLSRRQQHADSMGQTSSQVDPDNESPLEEASARHRKKTKRRSKVSEKSADLDEESARVLLQLREDAGNNHTRTKLANVQLGAQNSLASPPNLNGVENEMARALSKSSDPRQNEQRRKKKKRKRHDLEEASQHEVDKSRATIDDTAEWPSKQARNYDSTPTPNDRLSLKKSICNLDDILTDDETVATYLKEYEATFTNRTSQGSTQTGAVESDFRAQEPKATFNQDASSPPEQPQHQLPRRNSTSSERRENEKSKRKIRSDTVPETSDAGQEQITLVGQDLFAIDQEGSDEGFEAPQDNSTYPSDSPTDYDFPIDPNLFQDSPTPAPTPEGRSRRPREKTPQPLARASKPRGNKTQQGGQKGKHYDPPLEQIAQKGGMFTESEILKMDAFRDSYCRKNEITHWQFNELVQSGVRKNPVAASMWNEVHEITPYRTRMSTMRFCRRRYHNFSARGTWTQSEDERLKQAVAEKGNAWTAVGEMIERFPEDCRDRYRNYHINSEHRNRELWTEGEVRNLCRAVYDCMKMMKEERKAAREERFDGREVPSSEPDSDEEVQEKKLINWQAVSDRMGPAGGGRSRLQCSFKWGKMKTADRDRYLRELRAAAQAKPAKPNGKSKSGKKGWRMRQALKKLRNIKTGDRYDFLQALSTCGAVEERNIPYRLLGDEAFRSRWTSTERRAALEMFKREVPGADGMDYRDVVNRQLTQLMAESMDKIEERWDPKTDGDVNRSKRRRLTESEKMERENLRRKERERRLNIKSHEFVHSTDEDEEEDREKSESNPVGVELTGSEESDDDGLFCDSNWDGNVSD
ncbi:RNA polymerase I enhancer binding protein [Pseudocyphellaria aurata]|nr:RNA polymerase I enhancer binding protein [Pseudocyphellaria aurata]